MKTTPNNADGRRPTLKQIAELTGYSLMSCSYAINYPDDGHVSESTVAEIQKVADELGYHPQMGGRVLRGSASGVIALAGKRLPDLTPWVTALQQAGYLALVLVDDGPKTAGRLLSVGAEACIWFGSKPPSLSVKTIKAKGLEATLKLL